jgi:tetratricopeptide (TPR) repeat protein
MGYTRATTKLSGRRTVRVGTLLATGVLLLGACGCSGSQKSIAAIKSAYTEGNYQETITLCERALRNDIDDAEVYLYYGLSLVSLDRDAEAFERLDKAVSLNAALGPDVAARLAGKARDSLSRGKSEQATGRARTASEYDPRADIGPLAYLVARSCFEEKRWDEAARRYREALGAYPDTSAAEEAYYNLAACYAAAADSASAIETLEKQLAAFPRGPLASEAEWRLVNLLQDRARSEFRRGNYEGAAALASGIIGRTENGVAVQRARLLLGECYERMGDYASACEQYEAIIRDDQGASGRFVERARAKLKAIRDAGLR